MSQNEYELFLREIIRVSKKKSLACYWNNLAPRYKHENIRGITQDWKNATNLFDKDRVPFYSKFILEKIKF